MSITKAHRKEKWWFHIIRGINLFAFRYWWLILLLFALGVFSFFWFCNDEQDPPCAQISEVRSSIDEAIEDLSDCCSCNSQENTIPCDVMSSQNGGTNRGQEYTHWLGDSPGRVVIRYDMRRIPDQMEVYYDNVLVDSTPGLVSQNGALEFYYKAQPGKPKYCIVRMYAPQNETFWEYLVSCPQ
jgi:hypothetical protein